MQWQETFSFFSFSSSSFSILITIACYLCANGSEKFDFNFFLSTETEMRVSRIRKNACFHWFSTFLQLKKRWIRLTMTMETEFSSLNLRTRKWSNSEFYFQHKWSQFLRTSSSFSTWSIIDYFTTHCTIMWFLSVY